MSRPKLPSELHPDFPRGRVETTTQPVPTFYPASSEAFVAFHAAHPEFSREGDFFLICPYCGQENAHTDQMGYCCSEVGHCEWLYFGLTASGDEYESESSEPPSVPCELEADRE